MPVSYAHCLAVELFPAPRRGMNSSAQGNALGNHQETIEALKGRESFGCGASFALSGLQTKSHSVSQGVALGS